MLNDPFWPRANGWLASHSENPHLGVIGAPLNQSISPGRCDLAPEAVREALAYYSMQSYSNGSDIGKVPIRDFGNIDLSAQDEQLAIINGIRDLLKTSQRAIIIGGDNGVTLPGVLSLGSDLSRVGLITFDAHHDLRHMADGLHNGNPIRALLERGLPGGNIAQIGLMSFANSVKYARLASDEGLLMIQVEEVFEKGTAAVWKFVTSWLIDRVDVIYVDLDLDVVDRAFVPACPGARPGGLLPIHLRQLARFAGAEPKVRAMDIVELDQEKDVNRQTAMLAAACILEFASGHMETL